MPAGERGRSAQRGRGLKGAAASESAALAQLLGCARARWLRPGGGEDKDARKTPGPFFSSPHTHTKETGAQPQQGRLNQLQASDLSQKTRACDKPRNAVGEASLNVVGFSISLDIFRAPGFTNSPNDK